MKYAAIIALCLLIVTGGIIVLSRSRSAPSLVPSALRNEPTQPPSVAPTPSPAPLPEKAVLENDYHIFQSFNNCGPAALSMALSYYGINVDQDVLGQALRPYQVPGGDNDDKSVTLDELEEKSKEYGFIPYHRPVGSPEVVKRFIAAGIPVITRTWLKEGEDIGHYRVIKGYDETTKQFLQDDSLQGKNLWYTYDDFDKLWQAFNYEYLVLVPKEKNELARTILGENFDEKIAWEKALELSKKQSVVQPESVYPVFNEVVALTRLGRYEEATKRFETIEQRLSFRMLWYQIEPIIAYQKLKNFDKVFAMTDAILNNHNRAFSELYFLRGQIYEEQGTTNSARSEYEKAVLYNKNFKPAINALTALSS